MKLQIILETLDVKQLTNSFDRIIRTCIEKAKQTPHGPQYADVFKKTFWNNLKFMCLTEMKINIVISDDYSHKAYAYVVPTKPSHLFICSSTVEQSTDFLISEDKNKRETAIVFLIKVLVHETTHLKQFTKYTYDPKKNYTNLNKLHFEVHEEIEAICNDMWPVVKNYLFKDGKAYFDVGIIHNCLMQRFKSTYGLYFDLLPDDLKKKYYKRLYKMFTTDENSGFMPVNNIKKGDIVMVYNDPIEDNTKEFNDPYFVTDVDGYKITVQKAKMDTKSGTYVDTRDTEKVVNRMFVAPFFWASRMDMFPTNNVKDKL